MCEVRQVEYSSGKTVLQEKKEQLVRQKIKIPDIFFKIFSENTLNDLLSNRSA